jgi:hypothetical protein
MVSDIGAKLSVMKSTSLSECEGVVIGKVEKFIEYPVEGFPCGKDKFGSPSRLSSGCDKDSKRDGEVTL